MRLDGPDVMISMEEIEALAQTFNVNRSPVSLLPPVAIPEQVRARVQWELHQGDPTLAARLAVWIGALAATVKRVHLHYTVADETIGRSVFAWTHALPDRIVALSGTGMERRLGERSSGEIRLMVAQVLASEGAFLSEKCRQPLSTPALLVFLAILDQLRYARLWAMLNHVAPIELFSAADVAARLQACSQEDFRWPLNFIEKLTPVPIQELDAVRSPGLAFDELVRLGWIDVAADRGAASVFELTPAGQSLAQDVLHDVSKVGLLVAFPTAQGLASDLVLLVRSGLRLLMFYMTGAQAAAAAILPEELDDFLGFALASPEPIGAAAPAPSRPAYDPVRGR